MSAKPIVLSLYKTVCVLWAVQSACPTAAPIRKECLQQQLSQRPKRGGSALLHSSGKFLCLHGCYCTLNRGQFFADGGVRPCTAPWHKEMLLYVLCVALYNQSPFFFVPATPFRAALA